MIALTRRFHFPAAHVLRAPELSDAENQRCFGKCSNVHGHDYSVAVTVTGPVDPLDGRIVAPDVLDEIIGREVIERFGHRFLNDQPEFADDLPTAEIVARVIHDRLASTIAAQTPARLLRVEVGETRRNHFEYGEPR